MIVLYCMAWLVVAILALFLLILLMSVRYDLRGWWQEKFSGDFMIGVGPFQVLFKWTSEGSNIFLLRLLGITLGKSPLSKKAGMRKKEQPTVKKAQGSSWRDGFDFIEKDFIKSLLRLAKDILRHCSPQVMELKGVWGFNDPYYTGILAAVKTVIPGIQVEPDFTGEVRDLNVLMKGRIRPVVILYYGLRLLVSRQARPVLKKLWQKRKKKK